MTKALSQPSTISSVLIIVLGCVTLSSTIWTLCTTPELANVFWPGDIHRVVITALGGTVSTTVSGRQQSELEWLSVFLRVSGSLVSLGLMSVLFRAARARRRDASTTAQTESISLFETLRRIAFPWMFSGLWLIVWFISTLTLWDSLLSFVATIAPLCLAGVLAASCSNFVSTFGQTKDNPVRERVQDSWWPEFLVVVLAMIAWQSMSFWLNERLYAGLLVPHGDSAMYEEHLWNTWHGKGFRSYLDQGLFLGEHIQVIHLLLLPLHMVWPSYLMMEFVASLCLAICAVPIFSITLRHTRSSRAAMWLALAWLFYFPMHYLDIAIDLKTLRPSCYGMPFLFWGIDFAERRKLVRSSLCLLVALSTQEDFSLIVGPIGLVLFLVNWNETTGPDRRRMMAWSAGVLTFSVVYLLLAVLVVIPAFRGGESVHYSRYFGDLGRSPGELIRTAILEPARVLSVVFSFRTLLYLAILTIPVGCLAWRCPIYLVAGLPTFLMLSLIQLGNEPGSTGDSAAAQTVSQLPPIPYHHFHAPLLPIIFWSAAAGIGACYASNSRQRQRIGVSGRSLLASLMGGNSVSLARFTFFCAVGTAATGSMMPAGVNFWSRESGYGWMKLYVPGPRATEFSKVMSLLPADSRVASTDYVHTRLTHFERSYDYSDYPRAVNNFQPGVPDDTDYIVIDTSHPYSRIRTLADVRELKTEPESWEVLPDATNGLFIVLKRRLPDR